MKQDNAPIHFGIPKKPNGPSWNRFTIKTLVKSDIKKTTYRLNNQEERVLMRGRWYPNTAEGLALIKGYVLSMTPKHLQDKIVISIDEFSNPPYSHQLNYTFNGGEVLQLIPVFIKNNHIFIEPIARFIRQFILEDIRRNKVICAKNVELEQVWDSIKASGHERIKNGVKLFPHLDNDTFAKMSNDEWKAYMDELAEKGCVQRDVVVRCPELSVEQAILDKLAEDGKFKWEPDLKNGFSL